MVSNISGRDRTSKPTIKIDKMSFEEMKNFRTVHRDMNHHVPPCTVF